MNKEQYEMAKKINAIDGDMTTLLAAFGSDLAEREAYENIDGMEAIHLYLIRRYGWLPRDVTSMRPQELRLALHVEMQGWSLPPALR